MRLRALVVAFGILIAAGVLAASSSAKTVGIKGHSQSAVKASCNGVYWPGSGKGNTYGCLNEDGSGIVCGGVTAQQQKTCDTFMKAPSRSYVRALRVALARARP